MNFNNLYKYVKMINQFKIPANEFNKFMLELSDICVETSEIANNFNNYIEHLKDIYSFIFKHINNISIKVDSENVYSYESIYSKINKLLNVNEQNKYSFIDFGGGNGMFLNYLCKKMNTNKCYVIETKHDEFNYSINNYNNINHIFWDNKSFNNLENNSIDCCTIIMVLHHLTNELIDIVLDEVFRVLKVGGILYIVEHDVNKYIRVNIDVDHHIYYILNDQMRDIINKKLKMEDYIEQFKKYCKNYYINLKTSKEWLEIITRHRFKPENISNTRIPYNGKYYNIFRK